MQTVHGAETARDRETPAVRENPDLRTDTSVQDAQEPRRLGAVTEALRQERLRQARALRHVAEVIMPGGYSAIARRWNCHESLVRRRADPRADEGGRFDGALWFLLPKSAFDVYRHVVNDFWEHGPLPHLSEAEHALRLFELAGKVADTDVRNHDLRALALDLPALEEEALTMERDAGIVPGASAPLKAVG